MLSTLRNIVLKEKILIIILVVASILRFYNYPNRWGLAYDQAWFAVISRYALETMQLPLLGPFASGGPFQTGGEWFWIIMLGIMLNPSWVISPWIFITTLSIVQVFLLFILGKDFINRNFGYLVATLGAVSTSQTLQATNLTNQMTASICAVLFLIFVFRYVKDGKNVSLFFAGLFVGLSSAIHLQGVLLLPALFVAVVFLKAYRPNQLFLIFFGLLTPWLPVLLVDIGNNFYNTKNMLTYFTQPQSQISYEMLGRRWLTFVGIFIPEAWSRIIGGIPVLSYLQIGLITLLLGLSVYRKKLRIELWIVFISLIIMFFCLRYIRTPIYENYITFLHPFVFLLSGWMILEIYKVKKAVAIGLFVILVVGSIGTSLKDIKDSTNTTANAAAKYVKVLQEKYPHDKFLIYDYRHYNGHKSLPLVYFLQTEGLLSDRGRRIGVVEASAGAGLLFVGHQPILGRLGELQLYDLSSSNGAVLEKAGWLPVNPSFIYDSVQNWYKK